VRDDTPNSITADDSIIYSFFCQLLLGGVFVSLITGKMEGPEGSIKLKIIRKNWK